MKVEFLKQFSKYIDSINSKIVKQSLIRVIASLENAQTLSEIAHLKKLKGHRSAYRIRVGNYRHGLFFEDSTILLARFVHRREIYKFFP
jgi:mRNA interferase RelE/StbE